MFTPQLVWIRQATARPPITTRPLATWAKVFPRRIRVITTDVTGTLVSFRGSLSDHYLGSAAKCGVQIPRGTSFERSFARAYREMCREYPCFGSNLMSAKEWWKLVVLRSFAHAGTELTPDQQDIVFQRIYSLFGSLKAYEKFDDTLPFLHWVQRKHIVCGILSNADERYGDSILPMLGLTHDELQFMCFSKDLGFEKPDGRFFYAAMQHAEKYLIQKNWTNDPLLPGHVLHIGNDYAKDFEGAKRAGMHAVLLNRYNEGDVAQEWQRRGAIVLNDLMDVVEFLGRCNCQLG